jgi:AAA+ ATPase superfamily predicted ATPase
LNEAKKRTCEDRIDQELKDRVKEFQEALKSYDENGKITLEDGEEYEDLIDYLNSVALALTKTEVYRLELSYGGPQDYIEFEYDPETKSLTRITYCFLDWFDGAKREIKEGSEAWRVLERVFYEAIKPE